MTLTLIQMAMKKWVAMRLGVTYDSQAINRKQGGIPVRALLPRRSSIGHLGVIYDSQPKYTQKYYHRQVEALTFLLKNRLKQQFFIQTLTRYHSKTL
jgi:hypothetical protein